MPRIAIILGRLAMGGATLHALAQARHLQEMGHTVFFISAPSQANETDAHHLMPLLPGLKHFSIEGFGRNMDLRQHYRTYKSIKKLLRQWQPQLVHTHTPVAGIAGRLAAAALHIPAVHTYHGLLFEGYYQKFYSRLMIRAERYLASRSAGLIAISQSIQQALVDTYRIAPTHKVKLLPIGIDLNAHQVGSTALRHSFRVQFGLQENELAIAIVGRLVPIKNHALFLEVARQALTQVPGLRFFVIGDGELQTSLLNQSRQLGLDTCFFPEENRKSDICFTGWLPQMPTIMAGIDVLLLTSNNEGTPLVIMEAMAAGKPIIATDVGGIAEMVAQEQTGFLVPPNTPNAMLEKLVQMATQPSLRRQMGTNAAATAALHFSEKDRLQELAAWLQWLMDNE